MTPRDEKTACGIWLAKDHPLYKPDARNLRRNTYVLVLNDDPVELEKVVRRGATATPPSGNRKDVEEAGMLMNGLIFAYPSNANVARLCRMRHRRCSLRTIDVRWW